MKKTYSSVNCDLTARRSYRLLAVGLVALVVSAIVLPSCNVTRTVTTESRYIQRNDTSIVIQTKTVETYDATKKL